jgi:hypothetical protein
MARSCHLYGIPFFKPQPQESSEYSRSAKGPASCPRPSASTGRSRPPSSTSGSRWGACAPFATPSVYPHLHCPAGARVCSKGTSEGQVPRLSFYTLLRASLPSGREPRINCSIDRPGQRRGAMRDRWKWVPLPDGSPLTEQ